MIEMPLGPLYPKTLTNAAWQKKKTLLDKAKKETKTGLGAALTQLEIDWKDLDWDCLGARTQGKWHSIEELHAAKKKAQRYKLQGVTQFYNKVMAASRKARTTSQIAGLSSGAKTAAVKIADELKDIGGHLMGIEFDDFDEEEKRIRKGWAVWRARLPKNIADLEEALNELEDDPRTQKWDDMNMTDSFRSVGNSVGNNPEFKAFWPDPWQPLDGLQNKRHPVLMRIKNDTEMALPEEAKAIKELIEEAREAIEELKKKL